MDTALIVGSGKLADSLGKLLVPHYYARFVHAASASKARQTASRQAWGVMLISAPLPDENARQLAQELAEKYASAVVLLDEEATEGGQDGIITLVKPVNRVLFEHTMQIIGTAQYRLAKLEHENRKLSSKLEEERLVGRAKCALVAYHQMTEGEAHKYIEKTAMDSRLPRKEVARDILQVYDG